MAVRLVKKPTISQKLDMGQGISSGRNVSYDSRVALPPNMSQSM